MNLRVARHGWQRVDRFGGPRNPLADQPRPVQNRVYLAEALP